MLPAVIPSLVRGSDMQKNYPVTDSTCDYADDLYIETWTDTFGRIIDMNEQMVQVSGFSRDELLGSCHNIVRHPDMPEVAFEDLWKTLQSGNVWQGIVKNRCKNGDHYWICETIIPLYEGGELVGYRSIQKKPSQRQIALAEGLYPHLKD